MPIRKTVFYNPRFTFLNHHPNCRMLNVETAGGSLSCTIFSHLYLSKYLLITARRPANSHSTCASLSVSLSRLLTLNRLRRISKMFVFSEQPSDIISNWNHYLLHKTRKLRHVVFRSIALK